MVAASEPNVGQSDEFASLLCYTEKIKKREEARVMIRTRRQLAAINSPVHPQLFLRASRLSTQSIPYCHLKAKDGKRKW